MRASQADRFRLMLVKQVMNMEDKDILDMCRNAGLWDDGEVLNVLVSCEANDGLSGTILSDIDDDKFKFVLDGLMDEAAHMEEEES